MATMLIVIMFIVCKFYNYAQYLKDTELMYEGRHRLFFKFSAIFPFGKTIVLSEAMKGSRKVFVEVLLNTMLFAFPFIIAQGLWWRDDRIYTMLSYTLVVAYVRYSFILEKTFRRLSREVEERRGALSD